MRIDRGQETLEGARPYPLHLRTTRDPSVSPAYTLLIVHGTAGHGGCYERYVEHAARRGAAVVAVDLEGHGRSGGRRGEFRFERFLADVEEAARWARRHHDVPVVVLGASMGGEVAFHALAACASVDAAVCMNVLLNAEVPMRPAIRFMQSRFAEHLGTLVGDRFRIPLESVVDFRAAYREDPGLWDRRRRDPDYVLAYGFESYRSVFAYRPSSPASANTKPVLVACGDRDPIVGVEHCRACFDRIGGPKELLVVKGAGHQLMHFHGSYFAGEVDSFVRRRVLGRADAEGPRADERAYFTFLERQRATSTEGEPEYDYTALDRLLTAATNGTTEAGVAAFSAGLASEHFEFVSKVVAAIDDAAWDAIGSALPERDRPLDVAMVGVGSGTALPGLLARHGALARARLHLVDVDPWALDEAERRLAGHGVHTLRGDLRDRLSPDAFDVVYLHGILDHCNEHASIVRAAGRALRPGGRLFVVTPDRNVYTWLAFVAVGPRFLFGLAESPHDYRRFTRPSELMALFRDAGLEPVRDPIAVRPFVRGVEYLDRFRPWAVASKVRARDVGGMRFELTEPRGLRSRWFPGEFLAIAERPLAQA